MGDALSVPFIVSWVIVMVIITYPLLTLYQVLKVGDSGGPVPLQF